MQYLFNLTHNFIHNQDFKIIAPLLETISSRDQDDTSIMLLFSEEALYTLLLSHPFINSVFVNSSYQKIFNQDHLASMIPHFDQKKLTKEYNIKTVNSEEFYSLIGQTIVQDHSIFLKF